MTRAATDDSGRSSADDSGHPLDNATWHALTTHHAVFSEGARSARRYRADVSILAALGDDSPESWADLAQVVTPGEVVIMPRSPALTVPSSGWHTVFAGQGHQMVLTGDLPPIDEDDPAPRALTVDDVTQMEALVRLTEPGPFSRRTIELGGYVGIFEGDDLLAMAGQRVSIAGYTEISAVCTDPRVRRRGMAAIVTAAVARNLLAQGVTPVLHVAETNSGARRVYERLGFVTRTFVTFIAVRRTE
jgi:predicted GNAT family acetyltransferase